MSITKASECKPLIGKRLFWDDVSVRYVMLRSGVLEAVEGRNIVIDGDYKIPRGLRNLRTEPGPGWEKAAERYAAKQQS